LTYQVKQTDAWRGRLDPVLQHASHLPKPQLLFKTKVDNTDNSPWYPTLTHKYNAQVPLGHHYTDMDDDETSLHPYHYEIKHITYPYRMFQSSPPIPPKSFEETPFSWISTPSEFASMLDRLRGAFTRNPFAKEDRKLNTTLTFAGNQDLLDTLWGYYFATGSHVPIQRIMQMLPWSKSRDTVDKLTIGAMARYTLASYAIRDAGLREFLRSELARQPAPVKAPLGEVVEAADTVQIAALRKDALAAVDELKTKGSDSRRNLDFWGQVGVGAVALGCVSAAALGQVAVGIPCVIGGSASQGLLSFWEKQP